MNYLTNDGIVHVEVKGPEARRPPETLRVVRLACGARLEEDTFSPPWIYQRETRRPPTCVRCMARSTGGL